MSLSSTSPRSRRSTHLDSAAASRRIAARRYRTSAFGVVAVPITALRITAVGVVALAVGLALFGCDTGRRNDGPTSSDPGVDCSEDRVPFLLEASTDVACAGTVITLEGLNLALDPADNAVTFESPGGSVRVPAQVLQAVDNGLHPSFPGCLSVSLLVVVPTGAPSGLIRLEVRRDDGSRVVAGNAVFTSCPEIVGFGVGPDANGFLVWDVAGNFLEADLQLFGYGLDSVTDVEVVDPQGSVFTGFPLSATGTPNPNYVLPAGMEVVTVTVDSVFVPDCESFYFTLKLISTATGSLLESNRILVPVRRAVAPQDFEDLPGTVTGAFVPPGVRSGVIPITYQLVAEPAQTTYDVVPQYFDPDAAVWVDCTPIDSTEGINEMPGLPFMSGGADALVGGGAVHTFHWDSAAQIGGATEAYRVRLPVRVNTPIVGLCETTSAPDRRFELPTIVISNPTDAAGMPLVPTGTLGEEFNDTRALADGDAAWNEQSSGVLTSGVAPAGTPWGAGTAEVILESQHEYVFNTINGSLFDITDPLAPESIAPGQPGAAMGEFHFATLTIAEGADILVEGDAPLVVRLSGRGEPAALVAVLGSVIDLSGGSGTSGSGTQPDAGAGGSAGPGGGGRGGDGGRVTIDAMGVAVTAELPAERGANAGGWPGSGVTFARIGAITAPRAGAGGGGGCVARGADASDIAGLFDFQAPGGRGGPARTDEAVRRIVGGAGGGGGGATVQRISSAGPLTPRFGGGGGGGGGTIRVVAFGTVRLAGSILVNGGDGATGAVGSAGPGGGGSGGVIAVGCTGDIELRPTCRLEARGGQGGSSSVLTAGDGSDGAVRLEPGPGRELLHPAVGSFSQLVPGFEHTGVTMGLAAEIDSGTGLDGPAILTGGPGTQYVVDTDNGVLLAPDGSLVVARTVDTIDFHLSTLVIEDGVILRAMGETPLVLRVSGAAELDGTVDVSGRDGSPPDLSAAPAIGGSGGLGGPGSDAGGAGGWIDGSRVHHGGDGGLAHLAPYGLLDPVPPYVGGGTGSGAFPILPVRPAGGGRSETDGAIEYSGGGGGGGYAGFGADGSVGSTASSAAPGLGGSAYGSGLFTLAPLAGDPFPVGGGGGAGGGGHADSFTDPGFGAPGSGGGGGGGYAQVAVGGEFVVSPSARFLATGGRSFRAPLRGGNGGGGAGGGVYLQGGADMDFRGRVEVSGGLANVVPTGVEYLPNDQEATGGVGSPGRIRVESTTGFIGPEDSLISPDPSVGVFIDADTAITSAVSRPIPLTVEAGALTGGGLVFEELDWVATVPAGSDLRVFYSGARYSLDEPGALDAFESWVADPALLDRPDFIQLHFLLFDGGAPPVLDALELDYRAP